jgi:filamentous hemagglutinin
VHLTASGTLVNADKAVIDVERKINGYSLNPQHVEGSHKARVFKSVLGYDRQNSQGLVNQIRAGVQTEPAVPGKITEFGTQFGVDIPVIGPSGSATVRTGWNYDPGSDVPRLTTAVVKK